MYMYLVRVRGADEDGGLPAGGKISCARFLYRSKKYARAEEHELTYQLVHGQTLSVGPQEKHGSCVKHRCHKVKPEMSTRENKQAEKRREDRLKIRRIIQ